MIRLLNVLFTISACMPLLMGQDLMEPLYVTAARSEQVVSDVPYSAAYIDQNELQDSERRTLPKALLYTPGVLVQQTAYGHGSPFIRGLTGRQNLLLVDGVRINNSTFRGGPVQYWNTVDALSIDHIELIKSQGSVLYGSDAAGGTLNAFTKSSGFRAEPEGEIFSGGRMSYEYRMNGEGSHIGRFESRTGVGGKFGVHFGLSLKDYGDISDDSVGRMSGTGYPEQDFDLRADWAVDPDSTLTFVTQYVNQDDVSRWHRTIQNPGWTHDKHFAAPGKYTANTYDQERLLSYLRYSGSNPLVDAFVQRWTTTVSYQTSTDSEFQNRNPDRNSIRHQNIDVDTFGVDLTLESDTDHGTWIYGFDYYHDQADSMGSHNNLAGNAYKEVLPLADDSDYDLVGAFGQYIWRPSETWEVTGGARYTYANASLGRFYDSSGNEQFDEGKNWSAVVGSLRALHRLDDEWSVFGGVSQAFRAPNLNDLSGNVTSKAGIDSLGSLNVDPEEFLTYELGARHQSGELALQASVFYTDISDLIVTVPSSLGGPDITTNAADGYLYGVELEGVWNFAPQWSLRGFAAWQDGENETPQYLGGPISEQPPSRLLPLTGSVALRWTSESEKFWLQGRLFGAMTEDRTTAADQAEDNQRIPTHGTPGYVVASVNAGWQLTDDLNLTCSVENLLDQDHRIHGSGQNEAGLTGIFGLEWTW